VTYSSKLPYSILSASNYSARHMTAKLRNQAYKSGWPSHVARKLTVKHDGGDNFYVDYPKEIEKDVLDLEQGNQDNPPNAAILRFMNRSHPHIEDYEQRVFAAIMDMDVFK